MGLQRQRLARRRKSLGYSQEQLAERLGVERSTVVRWERGATDPQPWVRAKLVQALQVSTNELDDLLAADHPAEAESTRQFDRASRHPTGLALADVANLHANVQQVDEQYDLAPSTVLLADAGQFLGRIAFLGEAVADERTLRAFHHVQAEAATLMGKLIWDASQRRNHRNAVAYYDQAINAARQCRDCAAEGHALLRKSFIALYGQRDARAGLALARRTADTTAGTSHVLTGLALLHSAEAYAMLGASRDCERALGAAETEFTRMEAADVANESYSPAQFDRLAGSCYLALGNYPRAQKLLESSANSLRTRMKSRALVLGNLALTHIRRGQLDEGTDVLHEAIDPVTVTRGGGGLNVVFQAARELRPWRQVRMVQDIHDRLLSLMTT